PRRLRRVVRQFIQEPMTYNPSRVAIIRLDPEFGAIADQRILPELAREFREQVIAHLSEFLDERIPGVVLSRTESNDELLVFIPPGYDSNAMRNHLSNAINQMENRWHWTSDCAWHSSR